MTTRLYSAQSLGINGVTLSLHHTSLRYGELWRTKIHAQDLKNYRSYSEQFYTIKYRNIGFVGNRGDSTYSLLDATRVGPKFSGLTYKSHAKWKMLRGIYSAIYGEVNVSVSVCVEIKGDYIEK